MKNWLPLALFIVSGILTSYVQRAYYSRLARLNRSVSLEPDVADDLRAHPSRLPTIVATETSHRLRSLLRRSQDARVERLRWLMLGSVGLMLTLFAWFVFST